MSAKPRIVTPKKLLLSKWTAVTPVRKEKHFIVTRLVIPDLPDQAIEYIEIEAVHSKRSQLILWQQLNDASIWKQGWV
jgi:tryptophan-rich hypothetical protein